MSGETSILLTDLPVISSEDFADPTSYHYDNKKNFAQVLADFNSDRAGPSPNLVRVPDVARALEEMFKNDPALLPKPHRVVPKYAFYYNQLQLTALDVLLVWEQEATEIQFVPAALDSPAAQSEGQLPRLTFTRQKVCFGRFVSHESSLLNATQNEYDKPDLATWKEFSGRKSCARRCSTDDEDMIIMGTMTVFMFIGSCCLHVEIGGKDFCRRAHTISSSTGDPNVDSVPPYVLMVPAVTSAAPRHRAGSSEEDNNGVNRLNVPLHRPARNVIPLTDAGPSVGAGSPSSCGINAANVSAVGVSACFSAAFRKCVAGPGSYFHPLPEEVDAVAREEGAFLSAPRQANMGGQGHLPHRLVTAIVERNSTDENYERCAPPCLCALGCCAIYFLGPQSVVGFLARLGGEPDCAGCIFYVPPTACCAQSCCQGMEMDKGRPDRVARLMASATQLLWLRHALARAEWAVSTAAGEKPKLASWCGGPVEEPVATMEME